MDTYSHLPTFQTGTAGEVLARAGGPDACRDRVECSAERPLLEPPRHSTGRVRNIVRAVGQSFFCPLTCPEPPALGSAAAGCRRARELSHRRPRRLQGSLRSLRAWVALGAARPRPRPQEPRAATLTAERRVAPPHDSNRRPPLAKVTETTPGQIQHNQLNHGRIKGPTVLHSRVFQAREWRLATTH